MPWAHGSELTPPARTRFWGFVSSIQSQNSEKLKVMKMPEDFSNVRRACPKGP